MYDAVESMKNTKRKGCARRLFRPLKWLFLLLGLWLVFTYIKVYIGFMPANQVAITWLNNNAIPLQATEPNLGCDDLQPFLEMVGDTRLVALGEGSHGVKEYFTLKHRLVQCLVEEKGFSRVIFELGNANIEPANRYVTSGEGDALLVLDNMYTLNTGGFSDLMEWTRAYNASNPDIPIHWASFDVLSIDFEYDKVIKFLEQHDSGWVNEAKNLLACTKAENSKEEITICLEKIEQVLTYLQDNKTQYIEATSESEVAQLLYYARIIVQSQTRQLLSKKHPLQAMGNSYFRDEFMAENVLWLLGQYPDEKFILWAHNAHVKRADLQMGGYLVDALGADYMTVGLTAYEGQFNTSTIHLTKPNFRLATIDIPKQPRGSFEAHAHQTDLTDFYVDLRPIRVGENIDPSVVKTFRDKNIHLQNFGSAYHSLVYLFCCGKNQIANEFDVLFHIDTVHPSELFMQKSNLGRK